MRFLSILLLTSSLLAKEETFDLSASAWITASEDLNNEYQSLEKLNKVGLVRGSFSTRRLSVRANFVHNEKYEKENYVPYAVATLKLFETPKYSLVVEGGKSNEHSILNSGTNTPKSIGSSYPSLSYNDMGWDNEMTTKYVEAQFRFSDNNSADWQIGLLKGRGEFDSDFTVSDKLVGGRVKYSRNKTNLMYGYFELDQTFYGFEFRDVPLVINGVPLGIASIPFPTERDVTTKFHALSYDSYINYFHRVSGEIMYVDTMEIWSLDLRWIFPYRGKFTGLLATNLNTIDFDFGSGHKIEIKKGVTYTHNRHLSFTVDGSYFNGVSPMMINSQAVLPDQQEALNDDWGIISCTIQWDF